MTAIGLSFGLATGVLFTYHQLQFAFAFGFLSVFCDVLDGAIARKFQMESSLGRVFDAVADRFCEFAVVLGALFGGIIGPLGVLAIIGSTTLCALRGLSYSLGLNTDYVMFGRTERLIFIFIGLMTPITTVSTGCFVLAGSFGFVSSLQITVALSRRLFQPKQTRLSL
jgi:phosphatidylglycerophosphate synthase